MRSIRTVLLTSALVLSLAASAAAQQTVFVVRHAERADGTVVDANPRMSPAIDPPLSVAGHERAMRLAAMLRQAGIKKIFTTEFVRTWQTATPTAEALMLSVTKVSSKDLDALLAGITGAQGNVLVVGHSNTVPDVLKRLGIKDTVTIAESDYDNLFIVVRPAAGDPTLIRLRY